MAARSDSTFVSEIRLTLPAWIRDVVDPSRVYDDDDAKMTLAVELSRRNVEEQSGGPFGAAVYGPDQRILAVGVNGVVSLSCSVAHAETMACMLAQQRVGRARLNRDTHNRPLGPYTLAASSQPCCQCFGAIVWAGIDRLLIGARTEDVQALTAFDEGPLPDDWIGELTRRGTDVVRDRCRDQARDVLRFYRERGGVPY